MYFHAYELSDLLKIVSTQLFLHMIMILPYRCYHPGQMLEFTVGLRIERKGKKTETEEIVKPTTIQIIKQKNTGIQLLL